MLNALLLAEGEAPYHVEHPGTTVQVIGALALRAAHAVAGVGTPLRDDVLTHPERFAVTINAVLVFAMAAANTFQGWAVHRLTGSWACTITAQLAPFLPTTVLLCGIHVMAEPLLVALALVLSGGIALVLSDAASPGRAPWAVWLGVVMGLGVATKLLFAPLGLLPLVVLRRLRARLVFAGTAALTLGCCLIPVAARLPVTVAYYKELATHTGAYGEGDAGMLDLGASARVVLELVAAEPVAHAAALVAALVGGVVLIRSGEGSRQRRLAAALVAVALVQFLGDAATAKHPPARPYYLTSGMALSGLGLALVLALTGGPDAGPARRWSGRTLVGVLLAVGTLVQVNSALAARNHRRQILAAVGARVVPEAMGGSRVIHGHRVSSIPSALEFGNMFSGSSFSGDLRRLYPGLVLFDSRGIHAFGEPVSLEELRSLAGRDGSLRLWDSIWLPFRSLDWPSQAAVKTLRTRGYESFLRVRPRSLSGTPESAPVSPAVAGVLVVEGPDLWLPDSGKIPRYGLAPPTRLVFAGLGRPQWLLAEVRYEWPRTQGLRVSLNGASLGRYSLPPGRWIRVTIPLAAAPGINEIEIEYDRTRDGGPWPPLGKFPGLGPGRARRVLVDVIFRRLQIVEAGAANP